VIRLVEYETVTLPLTHGEARELAQMTRGAQDSDDRPRVIERLTPAATAGTYEIQPGPYVGRFRLRSGLVIDVTGRFPFHDLATLLALGRRTTMLYDDAVPAGGGHSLMDLIALAFVREAERIAGEGLAKAYERRSFTRPPYPGVPDVVTHLKAHAGRPDRLATVASRLTSDIPLNQLIATAHRHLCALTYQDGQMIARLRALAPVFHRIASIRRPLPTIADVPARYREIHHLAMLVLDEQTTLPPGAGAAGVSVLFNMTKIWEQHVGKWLRGPAQDNSVTAQYGILLTDSGPERNGYADFVVHQAGKPIAVYDAKYKPWRPQPTTDEIYQLYTYAHRLGVTYAGLVFPSATSRQTTTSVGNVTIENWGLPISVRS
jgi:5-methylcytosine-specific restriction endonuclease McrBC regulatory subunit McrC